MNLSLYSYDLIESLDKQYPEKCPDILDTERTIWMYAGKRELIRTLCNLRKKDELNKYKQPTAS
jgi:hypothetical protein